MRHIAPDRYDELRREWIAEHTGIWNMQKRRAELLNRQIRKRVRMAAAARPNPHDDNVIHPHWARNGSTVDIIVERIVVGLCALLSPVGWLAGRLLYHYLVQFIPGRLRAYPIPALLTAAAVIGTLTALLYSPDDTLIGTIVPPYVLAQIPATFAAAGIYGILNGWLAIDGSASWWPRTPPPLPVDLTIPMGPDDLTAPPVFDTDDPQPAVDMTPLTQITQSMQSLHLVRATVAVCAIGAAWMIGAVGVGINDSVAHTVSSPTWNSPARLH
ncbi:hypothetical protein [Mycobacterium intracellulare]|jgi:hypothetical protein|uniref:hypothetical protein n=1 Tax=Mycobacterium intracellulare TaxID=1767 RepID=UPI000BAC23AB|nr:hypothetical protein [Mycobacterium intracellulare]ASX03557.1 hypothetical protein CKJ58_26420 [Mycobacterium intracellulare subsp. chimaera]PBA61340.1 hypothetical protein CKJ56_13390 [Mycobacterium intracellulare subsp. chimaera]